MRESDVHETQPLLEVEDVSSGYGVVRLIDNITLSVNTNQAVALLGPNGSGKTTAMRTIVGLNPCWQGRVMFAGEDISDEPCHMRVRKGLGMVPAGRRLFLGLSVEDNLRMGAYLYQSKSQVTDGLERAYHYFPILREYRRQIAGNLSGGEQQMCAIARGLMSQPKVLLIDELSLGLAPLIVEKLLDTLDILRDQTEIGMLLVEQDVGAALELCDYAYVLNDGQVALSGTSRSLQNDPVMREIFIGASVSSS